MAGIYRSQAGQRNNSHTTTSLETSSLSHPPHQRPQPASQQTFAACTLNTPAPPPQTRQFHTRPCISCLAAYQTRRPRSASLRVPPPSASSTLPNPPNRKESRRPQPCLSNSTPQSFTLSVGLRVGPGGARLRADNCLGPFNREVSQVLKLTNPNSEIVAFKVRRQHDDPCPSC